MIKNFSSLIIYDVLIQNVNECFELLLNFFIVYIVYKLGT